MLPSALPVMEGFDPAEGIDGEQETNHEVYHSMAGDTAVAGSPSIPRGPPGANTLGDAFDKAKIDEALRCAICAALGR